MHKLTDTQHRNIAFWGMALIAMGLPLSVFLISVGTFVLAGNWLLEGEFKKRLKQFFTNPLSLALVSIYLLHGIGMFWTQDLPMGFKDLRVKLPLLLMPLFLFTSKLPSKKRIQDILLLFVFACLVGVLFGMGRYFNITGDEILNKRHLSVFISHIRFGLMLVLAFFILAYLLYAKWQEWSPTEKVICALSMTWILWFLVILEALTAYVAFAAVFGVSVIYFILLSSNRILKVGSFTTLLIITLVGVFYLRSIVLNHKMEVPFDYRKLTVKTLNGNYYAHQKDVIYRENGHRVWNFVCWDELKAEWPKRSNIDFEANDRRGQPIKFTAIRYLTSKGLAKDSVGVSLLTNADIANIENGYTNFLYSDKLGFARRVNQLLWAIEEYSWHQNANNSSTMQRWVYLQIGWHIFTKNPIMGVGTGDMVSAFRSHYQQDDHGLEKRFQGISHNQFLSIGIILGVLGIILFLVMLIYPSWLYRKDYLYVIFITTMLVSFLTDNTFDRQSGITLFAFFNALLMVRREFSDIP